MATEILKPITDPAKVVQGLEVVIPLGGATFPKWPGSAVIFRVPGGYDLLHGEIVHKEEDPTKSPYGNGDAALVVQVKLIRDLAKSVVAPSGILNKYAPCQTGERFWMYFTEDDLKRGALTIKQRPRREEDEKKRE